MDIKRPVTPFKPWVHITCAYRRLNINIWPRSLVMRFYGPGFVCTYDVYVILYYSLSPLSRLNKQEDLQGVDEKTNLSAYFPQ